MVSSGPLRQHHRPLDRVLQLAHVARPVVRQQRVQGARREPLHLLAVGARVLLDEVADQRGNVALALAQRRQRHRHHVEPVVEVLAEAPGLHLGGQVAVGGRHQAHVDLQRLGAAHALELAVLQHPQQLDLQRGGDLADLVEEAGCRRRPARSGPRGGPAAPVKLPFSWPNSSLSSSVSDSAAQFTLTKGLSLRGDSSCRACAISSLPVPDSPRISTVALVGAARLTTSKTACSSGASPTMLGSCSARAPGP